MFDCIRTLPEAEEGEFQVPEDKQSIFDHLSSNQVSDSSPHKDDLSFSASAVKLFQNDPTRSMVKLLEQLDSSKISVMNPGSGSQTPTLPSQTQPLEK